MVSPSRLRRWLPAIGSRRYHLMLALVALGILGPLAGISAAFMTFSIGFYLTGSVLAGILGSVVTLPYGPEGKHGGNYIQTMATSVGGMSGMVVLVQASAWMGLPVLPAWQMVIYLLSIGMLGVGIGMLYTPVLVDRMQLTYPSGLAVANILRALTDPVLLKRSVAKLGGGMGVGYVVGLASLRVAALGVWGVSASTFGTGMIIGLRLVAPSMVVALIGWAATPHLVQVGWLPADAPFRRVGFMISLGGIMGAALVDLTLILTEAARKLRRPAPTPSLAPGSGDDWRRVNRVRLMLWIVFWSVAVVVAGHVFLGERVGVLCLAVALCFVFVLVNGIAQGISDFNPISSAFVVTLFILAGVGVTDPGAALMVATIIMLAAAEGADMQQDRSTGWRLGTSRVIQFRYQAIGIAFGAVWAIVLGRLFLRAFPILSKDQFAHPHLPGTEHWQSAMTYKLVGALRGVTHPQAHIMAALWLGVSAGLTIEVVRKLLLKNASYQRFRGRGRWRMLGSFVLESIVFPSPYAAAYGGFFSLITVYWFTAGGVANALLAGWEGRRRRREAGDHQALPADMDTCSLFGGGLVAGDALSALTVGLSGLAATFLGH